MAKTNKVINTDWTPFEEFGAYFRIEKGVLVTIPMLEDGSIDKEQLEEGAIGVDYLVSGEEEEGFLEAINEKFGSDFTYEQFIQ